MIVIWVRDKPKPKSTQGRCSGNDINLKKVQLNMADEVVKTMEQLMAEGLAAFQKGDMKAVKEIATAINKITVSEEKAKKEAIQTKLAGLTDKVKSIIDKALTRIIDSGELDGADGIWYAQDFGEKLTTCKLTKAAARKAGTGAAKPYVTDSRKTDELLAAYGEAAMYDKDTVAMIAKVETTVPAGMSLNEAYKLSTDGNWRFRIRTTLLKIANKANEA